jgi:uncharacterized membrane protein
MIAGGIMYPVLAYVSLSRNSSFFILLLGMVLIALRMWVMRRSGNALAWVSVLALIVIVMTTVVLVSPPLAVKVYPALISAAAATVFGISLIWPPSLIEQIARLAEPSLSPQGQIYTRRVTQVWTAFLLVNAGISGAISLWGSTEQWALWNGLISYLLMGGLFIGEFILRQYVRRRI